MIKKLLIAALLFITTACTTHHSFMDNALVGYVDGGNQPIVMFPIGVRNGIMLYKPQFTGDCGKVYNSDYQSDNTTTNCYMRAERINGIHSYNQHIGKYFERRADKQNDHEFIEGVNNFNHSTDGI